MGQGLQKVLKMCGRMYVSDRSGKKVYWLWDYANDKARLESDMTKEEINASEKAKFTLMKNEFDKLAKK